MRPVTPTEHAYVGRSDCAFHDECLNEVRFISIGEARHVIEAWRRGVNVTR